MDTGCAEANDCEGADIEPADGKVDFIDFTDFALDWLQCNIPGDPNCTPNW